MAFAASAARTGLRTGGSSCSIKSKGSPGDILVGAMTVDSQALGRVGLSCGCSTRHASFMHQTYRRLGAVRPTTAGVTGTSVQLYLQEAQTSTSTSPAHSVVSRLYSIHSPLYLCQSSSDPEPGSSGYRSNSFFGPSGRRAHSGFESMKLHTYTLLRHRLTRCAS